MSAALPAFLGDATITVETTLLPDFTVRVGDLGQGEQTPLTQALRPKVTVRSASGSVLFVSQPAGDPAGLPLGPILAVASLAFVWWALSR